MIKNQDPPPSDHAIALDLPPSSLFLLLPLALDSLLGGVILRFAVGAAPRIVFRFVGVGLLGVQNGLKL